MYFDDYDNYYNEPSEVEVLFNEFSQKLQSMLKNEVINNAKKYDVNKDEVKTMMMVANGLKEEYEKKLEYYETELNKKSMEHHNMWLKRLLNSDLKVGDTVYRVINDGSIELTCPYCEKGKVQVKLKDRVESVDCPICKKWKPRIQKYTYKKTKIGNLRITLNIRDNTKKAEPFVDTWIDIPDYPFDKATCNWNIKDENWDTITSDRCGKTEDEAKQIIEKLKSEEINQLELKYGKENVKTMMKDVTY